MPTLLIGWELGGGGGHIHRLVPVIYRYLDRGWKIVAAVRLRHAAEAHFSSLFPKSLADGQLVIIQAPIFVHRSPGPVNASSLAEMFAHIGFASTELLTPVVSARERVIAGYRPDVILSDTAPSLNLAAIDRVPVIVIGNGWTIPPDTQNPAPFKPRSGDPQPAISASTLVIDTAFRVTAGRYSSGRFSDLLRGSINMVCTLGELDPYADQRKDSYYWPFEIAVPSKVTNSRKRGFIYLPKNHAALPAILAAAAASTLEFDRYFEGYQPSFPNIRVAAKPLDLAQILPSAALAIHHGGFGTAIGGWINGVPQIVDPPDTEKMVIGLGLERYRAGKILPQGKAHNQLVDAFERTARFQIDSPDLSAMTTTHPEATLDALCFQTGISLRESM